MSKIISINRAVKNSAKLSGSEQVVEFMSTLNHPLKEGIEEVRKIILIASKDISEHIKWNAPSFCYNNEDRITFNIRSDYFLLIFHRGAKTKENKNFVFNEDEGLFKWLAKDRASVEFHNLDEIRKKKTILKKIASKWIKV